VVRPSFEQRKACQPVARRIDAAGPRDSRPGVSPPWRWA